MREVSRTDYVIKDDVNISEITDGNLEFQDL
jgi:hypothetical protein